VLSLLKTRGDSDCHTQAQAKKTAYVFLQEGEEETESISYVQLAQSVDAAAHVLGAHLAPGQRVLLALPDGIDFIIAFLACLRAGLVAVPVKPPQNREAARKVLTIADNCGACAIVCSDAMLHKLHAFFPDEPALLGMQHITQARLKASPLAGGAAAHWPTRDPAAIAYLQYTSGSTGSPKGVMVTHANVMANEEMIRLRWGSGASDVLLSWLPMFHDMGLVAAMLHSLYLGATCVLMPPIAFVQKPARWMAAVAKYRATITGGPNFAFRAVCAERTRETTADADLSSLRVVYCGSEPIAPTVVLEFLRHYEARGFDPRAFSAGYGMAEATLMVSAGGIGEPAVFADLPLAGEPRLISLGDVLPSTQRNVISCGQSLSGQRIRIVDPETFEALQDGHVGEVWLHGDHIAIGYWANPEATEATFRARIAGEDDRCYLRTGDLGFMLGEELFITGRIKELMIFNGTNHYPQDMEEAAAGCHPALSLGRSVAFSVPGPVSESLVLVQEINRDPARQLSAALASEIAGALKSAIYARHAIPTGEVVLVRLNSIPRTTSGKLCRVSCKKRYLAAALDVLPLMPVANAAEAAL
jgi:acyl-CoA synthetase (AMP-forming)/AMP-acid ligase II